MRIVHKLILGIAATAAAITAAGVWASREAHRELRRSIEATNEAIARSIIDEIDRSLSMHLNYWSTSLHDDRILRVLDESNVAFDAETNIQARIDDVDARWRRDEAPEVDEILASPVSRDLIDKIASLDQANGYPIVAEVFITNRFGANVA